MSTRFFLSSIVQGLKPWQQPVFLLDVPFSDLLGIVEFIYHGEVSVDKECLTSFLKTAQLLRVKGLTEENQGGAADTSVDQVPKAKNEEQVIIKGVGSKSEARDSSKDGLTLLFGPISLGNRRPRRGGDNGTKRRRRDGLRDH